MAAVVGGRGGATSGQQRAGMSFFFFYLAHLPVLEPEVMAFPITVKLKPTCPKTGGGGCFQSVVMGVL